MKKHAKGIFVTGTDTGVGKTAISGGIAGALASVGYDVGVMKPVQSGSLPDGSRNTGLISQDASFMLKAAGISTDDAESDYIDLACPLRLKAPLAPSVAAELENHAIDIDLIKEAYDSLCSRHDIVIVEGIGGITVPITNEFLVKDLIKLFDIPALIVARPDLGTINHTFLTVEYARMHNIYVGGIIINGYTGKDTAERTNPDVISELTGISELYTVPFDPEVDVDACLTGNIAEHVRQNIDLNGLLEMVRNY
jgi:dethiobiotin synthetase